MLPSDLESRLAEFAEIARTCPPEFREACFQVLLYHHLRSMDSPEQSCAPLTREELEGYFLATAKNSPDRSGARVPASTVVWVGRRRAHLWRWWSQSICKRTLERVRATARSRHRLAFSAVWSIVTLGLFLLVEAAVFRSGWYEKYVKPGSTTGQVEYHLFWLTRHGPQTGREVMVVGDSRVAEGFSAGIAHDATDGTLRFISYGMPGTSPRVWYYALRDADPRRDRFAAIVIGLDHYSDFDSGENLADRESDISYVIVRLRLSDCRRFADSFAAKEIQQRALTGCLFKGTALRADIVDFLGDIPGRLKIARDWRNNGLDYTDGYGGRQESLAGLSADLDEGHISFPPGVAPWQVSSVKASLLPAAAPQTGALTAYRSKWLGALISLYKDSATRIVFIEMPRGPLPTGASREPAIFLRSVEQDPEVTILPANTFEDLQRPEIFADGLHLNSVGRRLFSNRLGALALKVLK